MAYTLDLRSSAARHESSTLSPPTPRLGLLAQRKRMNEFSVCNQKRPLGVFDYDSLTFTFLDLSRWSLGRRIVKTPFFKIEVASSGSISCGSITDRENFPQKHS